MWAALLVFASSLIQTDGGEGATVRVASAPTLFFAGMATHHHPAKCLLRLRGGWDGDGDDEDLAAAEADFEAAMNAAGSAGEGEWSSEKSAPTRGPSSAQRGGQAESGGSSGYDDFPATSQTATATETERRHARQESRRLESRSSDSVKDDIFRGKSGERGCAVTSGGPGTDQQLCESRARL